VVKDRAPEEAAAAAIEREEHLMGVKYRVEGEVAVL
jgi:hypothetical protein